MRTKNFIKTVKNLISSPFNLPQDLTIEDLTQPDGPLVPIVHYPVPPIPPTYAGMRPPVLLTASQAEQIVEMGGDLENVIITDRLPPIPEDCQVPTTTMPCSYGGYAQDDYQEYTGSDESQILTDYTEFTPEMFEYLLSRSRNGYPNIQSIQTDLHPVDYDRLQLIRNGLGDWPQVILSEFKTDDWQAYDKMQSCPYFANSPYLKCTANPTNTNCLECNEYEHHNSNEMDS